MKKLSIIGLSNTGKTSLYNRITGKKAKTANYFGVTVSKNTSKIKFENEEIEINDLPGLYSLYVNSQDEYLSLKNILEKDYDALILVSSVDSVRNSLKLLLQLKKLNVPVILVVNKTKRDLFLLDKDLLQKELDVPVVYCDVKKINVKEILSVDLNLNKDINTDYLSWLEKSQKEEFIISKSDESTNFNKEKIKESVQHSDIVNTILNKEGILKKISKSDFQNRLDHILIHRFWGMIIFVGLMFFSFDIIFRFSNFFTDYIDISFSNFINFTEKFLSTFYINKILVDLITNGVLPALSGIFIFVPQIFILFFFVRFLEESGYMVRVVFLLDKLMKSIGLDSKSLVPYISGTTCSVPAILACRTIENKKMRFVTIMTIPFTTCSAKIPIYTIIISLVVPNTLVLGFFSLQSLALIILYFLGYIMAIFSAILLKKFSKKDIDHNSKFLIEFPNYQLVSIRELLFYASDMSKKFVLGIGKVIVLLSIFLWFLSSYTISDNTIEKTELEYSMMGKMGKYIEPVIEPLGYDWKIGISLISSVIAREAFVGSLASIYGVEEDDDTTLLNRMRSEINPKNNKPVFNLSTGFSILIFYAFALQCMSTIVIIKKELGSWKYSIMQFIIMNILAYFSAMGVYSILS